MREWGGVDHAGEIICIHGQLPPVVEPKEDGNNLLAAVFQYIWQEKMIKTNRHQDDEY